MENLIETELCRIRGIQNIYSHAINVRPRCLSINIIVLVGKNEDLIYEIQNHVRY